MQYVRSMGQMNNLSTRRESNPCPPRHWSDALTTEQGTTRGEHWSYLLSSLWHAFFIVDQQFGKRVSDDQERKMLNFKLGEEIRRMEYSYVTSVGQRKTLSPRRESNPWPSVQRSDALTTDCSLKACHRSEMINSFTRKDEGRERIFHTWVSSDENDFVSIFGSVSYCEVILTITKFILINSKNAKPQQENTTQKLWFERKYLRTSC